MGVVVSSELLAPIRRQPSTKPSRTSTIPNAWRQWDGGAHRVRVMVAGKIIAESTRALRLEEKGYPPVYYLPRNDADLSLLVRTTHYTYCPYKGDCTYYSIPIGVSQSAYAVWTYERPYEAMAKIKEHLAFYPSRVDAIEVIS